MGASPTVAAAFAIFSKAWHHDDISSLRVDPPVTQGDRLFQGWRPEGCDRVALVLQGGGALGAYQAGVYQALHECGIEPDWVSGVSIGAINAAIIAGNVPDQRLSRLRTFWELITDRKIWPFTPDGDVFRKARNATSSWMTMLGGQPGFFEPRVPSPWLSWHRPVPALWSMTCIVKKRCITSEHDQRRVHLGGRTDDRFGLWCLCVAAVDGRLQELSLARIGQAAVGEPAMPERRAVRSDRSILSGATLRVRGAAA
jgi:predicted acylesterase/phospholipase RssA